MGNEKSALKTTERILNKAEEDKRELHRENQALHRKLGVFEGKCQVLEDDKNKLQKRVDELVIE